MNYTYLAEIDSVRMEHIEEIMIYIVSLFLHAELCFVSRYGGSLSPQHGASPGCGLVDGLQVLRVAANTLNKQPGQTTMGGPSVWGFGMRANNTSS
jgi:hypothetical protein